MAGLGNLFQKAVYLGVGLASYAGDKASQSIVELREQAQTLADELVQRGEMTTEEARRMVDDLVNRSQVTTVKAQPVDEAPRPIEIDLDESPAQTSPASAPSQEQQANALRQQVAELQAQLEQLKRKT